MPGQSYPTARPLAYANTWYPGTVLSNVDDFAIFKTVEVHAKNYTF